MKLGFKSRLFHFLDFLDMDLWQYRTKHHRPFRDMNFIITIQGAVLETLDEDSHEFKD